MPDKIKEAFEAIKDTKIFTDENDFRNQVAKDPKGVFDLFNEEKETKGLFTSIDDFNSQLGLKKKDGSTPAKTGGIPGPSAPLSTEKERRSLGVTSLEETYQIATGKKPEFKGPLVKTPESPSFVKVGTANVNKNIFQKYEQNQKALKEADDAVGTLNMVRASAEAKSDFVPVEAQIKRLDSQIAERQKQRQQIRPIAETSYKAIEPELDRLADEAVKEKGVNYWTTINETGDKVPDSKNKIDKWAKEVSKSLGLPDNGFTKKLLYNKMNAVVDFNLIKPKIEKEQKIEFKSKYGIDLDEAVNKDIQQKSTKLQAVKLKAEREFKSAQKDIKTELETESKVLYSEYEPLINNQKLSYTQKAEELGRQAEKLNSMYQQGLMDQTTYVAQFEQYKTAFDQLNKQNATEFDNIFSQYQKKQNAINSKYDRRYQRQAQEIQVKYQSEIDKIQKDKDISPELKKKLLTTWEAASEKVGRREEAFRYYKDKSKGYYTLAKQSILSSFGDGIKIISSHFGLDAGYVYGDALSKSYTLSTSELNSAMDLLDPVKFIRSSGQMIGTQLPITGLNIAAAALTRGRSTAVQLAVQGGIAYTYDNIMSAGQLYDDVFLKTGSVEKAKEAANKSVVGNTLLLPLYALDGIPFLDNVTLGIKNTLLKAGAKGLIETVKEVPQEYFQNEFEDLIKKDKSLGDVWENMSLEKWGKTAINVGPGTIAMGSTPTLIGAGMKYAKMPLEYAQGKTTAALVSISDMNTTNKQQWFYNMYLNNGSTFAKAAASSYFSAGQISESELNSFNTMIKQSEAIKSNSEKNNLDPSQSRIYAAMMFDYAKAKSDFETATDDVSKAAAEERMKATESAAAEFLNTKKGSYAILTFPNKDQFVYSFNTMNDIINGSKNIQDLLRSGEAKLSVVAEGANKDFSELRKTYEPLVAKKPEAETTPGAEVRVEEIKQTLEEDKKATEAGEPILSTKEREDLEIELESIQAETETETKAEPRTVNSIVDTRGIYEGKTGEFTLDGKSLVFRDEKTGTEYEIGNIDEIGESDISQFKIESPESVVSIDNKGNITVRNEPLVNNFSNPLAAINRDADGNIVSVNLETPDGQKRTFRGNIAEDLAYNIVLKNIEANDDTRTAFEEFINEDTEASTEVNNAGLPKTTEGETEETGTEVSKKRKSKKLELAEKAVESNRKYYEEKKKSENRYERDQALSYFRDPIRFMEDQVEFWSNALKSSPEDVNAKNELEKAKRNLEFEKQVADSKKVKEKKKAPASAKEKVEKKKQEAKETKQEAKPVSGKDASAMSTLQEKHKGDAKKSKILNAVVKGLNAIKSLLPNVDIMVFENASEFEAAAKRSNANPNSNALFVYSIDPATNKFTGQGQILINLEKANVRSVAHEIAHAVLAHAFGEKPALFADFKNKITSLIKNVKAVASDGDTTKVSYKDKQYNMVYKNGEWMQDTPEGPKAVASELKKKAAENYQAKKQSLLKQLNDFASAYDTLSDTVKGVVNKRGIFEEMTGSFYLDENSLLFKDDKTGYTFVVGDIKEIGNKTKEEVGIESLDAPEEFLVELAGYIASGADVSTSFAKKVAALINDIVSKITGGRFTPFQDIANSKDVLDFFNTLGKAVAKGEELDSITIEAISQGVSVNIGDPTNIIRSKAQLGQKIKFPENPLVLSFVTDADKIDIESLIDEIIQKKQKVWFWMADQLGRGYYSDEVIKSKHYLDAGPSFALDPKNKKKNILWASGLAEKTLQDQIDKADYIFFISGSPEKAKLFNKSVLNLIAKRIEKKSTFQEFKNSINNFAKETIELKTLQNALAKANSFDELANSSRRKDFLLAIDKIGKLKTAPEGSLKQLLSNYDVFIDLNTLRDGFYLENGFNQNDIMLVGKPTGLGGKAPHSTYETAILGKVIGVPDKKIDAWDIMPQSLKDKYASVIAGKEATTKAMQAKIIAAETGVVRELEPIGKSKSKAQVSALKDVESTTKALEGRESNIFEKETPKLKEKKLTTNGLPDLEIIKSKEASEALESNIGGTTGVIDNQTRYIPIQEYDVLDNKRSNQIADQILENEYIEPLIVSYDKNGNVYIVEGQHRAGALKKLGYDKAPVIVIYDKNTLTKNISEAYHKAKADGGNPELVEAVENLLAPETKTKAQVSGFHGSPYDFEKFTTEKIGTGEGAQAFGWGLYFTDVKDIAKHYAEKLSNITEKDLRDYFKEGNIITNKAGGRDRVVSLKYISPTNWSVEVQEINDKGETIGKKREHSTEPTKENFKKVVGREMEGNVLYEVTLHKGKSPSEYTWLEWDKMMPNDVFQKIKTAIQEKYGKKLEDYDGTPILDIIDLPTLKGGVTMYKTLSRALGGDKKASLFLLDAGIDGIKYPAESLSRGATAETAKGFNYVVFDENAVTIEQKVKYQLAEKGVDTDITDIVQDYINDGWTDLDEIKESISEIMEDSSPELAYDIEESFKALSPKAEQKVDYKLRDSELFSKFEKIDKAATKIQEYETAAGRMKAKEKYSAAVDEAGLNKIEAFVEKNYDDLVKYLKEKELLNTQCK